MREPGVDCQFPGRARPRLAEPVSKYYDSRRRTLQVGEGAALSDSKRPMLAKYRVIKLHCVADKARAPCSRPMAARISYASALSMALLRISAKPTNVARSARPGRRIASCNVAPPQGLKASQFGAGTQHGVSQQSTGALPWRFARAQRPYARVVDSVVCNIAEIHGCVSRKKCPSKSTT